MRRRSTWITGIAVGLLALAGCGSSGGSSSGAQASSTSSSAGAGGSSGNSAAVLKTADTPLGTVVVDNKGMTVYVSDKDSANSGASACSGQCLVNWPAVAATSESPSVDGVTGTVGTITRDDGTKQITLNGLPLYTFVGDSAAGDTKGQGVQGIWWAVGTDGAKISGQSPSSGSPNSMSSGGSGGY